MKAPTKIPLAIAILTAVVPSMAQTTPLGLPYSWMEAKWSASEDNPFRASRQLLESSPKQALQTFVREVRQSSLQGKDRQQVYRAALAGYLLANKFRDNLGDSVADKSLIEMERRPYGASYNYSRIHYILLLRRHRVFELKPLGLRLCQQDARDYDVRYLLCTILRPEQKPEDKKLALRLLDQMKKLQPQRASLYSLAANVHFRLWLQSKNTHERDLALAGYRKYLQLAPNVDPFRPQAQRLIAMMNANR